MENYMLFRHVGFNVYLCFEIIEDELGLYINEIKANRDRYFSNGEKYEIYNRYTGESIYIK